MLWMSALLLNAQDEPTDRLTKPHITKEWKDNFEVPSPQRQWAELEDYFLKYNESSDVFDDLLGKELYLFYRADLELEYATKLAKDYQKALKRLKTDGAIQKAKNAYRDKAMMACTYWDEYLDWYRHLGDDQRKLGERHSPSSPSSNRPQVAVALLGESYRQQDKPDGLYLAYEGLELDFLGQDAIIKWKKTLEDEPTTEPGPPPPTAGRSEQEKLINSIDRWQRQDHWRKFAEKLHKLATARQSSDPNEADFYEQLAKSVDDALAGLKEFRSNKPLPTPSQSP